ncbi:PTS transporter subunit IIC [Enterococcus hulanensis]|uniref:PTS transporter subunit IIC n=1 Tax=Enterococcus hulanensis TaxID=2559929 RepID=A0ABU3ETJ0_9ENTE|nr:PTS transporter subunit IIC [Enterococcus hulanensis]MDT2598182.1 PTS transporter subunit IIC [Enterococcus hulanensis]MDT2608313.1 PTS transporter subunit IIC [Enterococcus hulanensis]MDT2615608.1 PTS transporter subunit IIC [Enterococcus hulanensis]MDT2626421.1 PTS transporter subunit IIC [Enterococcus hulanensis]MDT2654680.1 PTS transporter subunit IIC [Enterococcus hulanensis]
MEQFMETFKFVMSNFGAAIMLPVLIFVVELFLRVPIAKAVKSAIYIGIGLNALISILNPFFLGLMGGAVQDMVTSTGIELPYLDTGWGILSALSYSTSIGAAIIPVGLAVNFLLLKVRLTDTLNLDIWNYWVLAFTGSLIYYQHGSYFQGLAVAVALEIALLLLADFTAPICQKFFGLPNISISHITFHGGTIVAMILRKPLELLGITKIKANSEAIRSKLGLFGDQIVVGFLVAVLIGIVAWFNRLADLETWSNILKLGVGTGAFIYLYPKATAALLEGFRTLSDRVREVLQNKGNDRTLHFGMDGALTVGHPDAITVGLLTMITTVALIFLLPGNKFLMLADLGVTLFFLAAGCAVVMKGNIIASYISTTVAVILTLYGSTIISPVFAGIAGSMGFDMADTGAAQVGADQRPLQSLFYFIGQSPVLVAIAIAVILGIMYVVKKKPAISNFILGVEEPAEEA